jgi:hypothetical protein
VADGIRRAGHVREHHASGRVRGRGDEVRGPLCGRCRPAARCRSKDDTLQVDSADEVVLFVAAGTELPGLRRAQDTPARWRRPRMTSPMRSVQVLTTRFAQSPRRGASGLLRPRQPDAGRRQAPGAKQPPPSCRPTSGTRPSGRGRHRPGPGGVVLQLRPLPPDQQFKAREPCPPTCRASGPRASQTPWNCDYHIDINVQMNYWPAEM